LLLHTRFLVWKEQVMWPSLPNLLVTDP
jgi:hypothetical protein